MKIFITIAFLLLLIFGQINIFLTMEEKIEQFEDIKKGIQYKKVKSTQRFFISVSMSLWKEKFFEE